MLAPIAVHPKQLSLGFSAWRIQTEIYRFSRDFCDSRDEIDPAPSRHTCPTSVCKDPITPIRVYRIYTPPAHHGGVQWLDRSVYCRYKGDDSVDISTWFCPKQAKSVDMKPKTIQP